MRSALALGIVAVALVSALAACDNSATTASEHAEATPKKKAPARPATEPATRRGVRVPYDRSWSVAHYAELGMPDPDHIWTGKDFKLALACLQQVVAQKPPGQPPRYASEPSGPVYLRMISNENLKPIRSKDEPLGVRLKNGVEVMQGLRDLERFYAGRSKLGQDFDDERADLVDTLLQVIVLNGPLTDEFATTFSEDSPTYKQTKAWLDRVQTLRADYTEECLADLSEDDHFRPSVMVRLAERLALRVPIIMNQVPADRAGAWIHKVQDLADKQKVPDIREALENLLKQMRDYREQEDKAHGGI